MGAWPSTKTSNHVASAHSYKNTANGASFSPLLCVRELRCRKLKETSDVKQFVRAKLRSGRLADIPSTGLWQLFSSLSPTFRGLALLISVLWCFVFTL